MDPGQGAGDAFKSMRVACDKVDLDVLCSSVVLLPGCVAETGSPIIFFPSYGDSSRADCAPRDICTVLQYYMAVDRWRNADPKPFSVLIDQRNMAASLEANVLQTLQLLLETDGGVVDTVIWIVNEDEADTFRPPDVHSSVQTHVESARSQSLAALVRRQQQPLDIGGAFLFDLSKWLHYRMYMETVLLNCEDCLHKAEAQLTALRALSADMNMHNVDINRRKAALLVSTLTLRLPGVVNSARWLLEELQMESSDVLEKVMAGTRHYQAAIGAAEDVLRRLADAKQQLQAAAGLENCGAEELTLVGCGGEDCPLAKIQQHGIPSYYTTMRLGESLGETQVLWDNFNTYMNQCKSYLDHRQCTESESSVCNMVIACFSAALQHRYDQLASTLGIHVRCQTLMNWAILTLNLLASQHINSAVGVDAARDRLFQITDFLASSPAPIDCGGELGELYNKLSQPCVLILHCQAVSRMVSVASHHLDMRREYLQRLIDQVDLPDGGGVDQAMEDLFASVGVSDSEDEMYEEDEEEEVGDEDSSAMELPKFEHASSGTPPRKIRAEEIGGKTGTTEAVAEDDSMYGTWLRRLRHVADTAAALGSALWTPVSMPHKLPHQLSTCVDDAPPTEQSWLIDLKEDDGGDFFPTGDGVDADAAALQALLRQRQELINELIEHEEKYIEDLGHLVKNYVIPFSQDASRPTSLIGQKSALFSNIEKILEFNQTVFLPSLKQIRKAPLRLGACFLEHERQFSTYSLYFKSMPSQERLLSRTADYFKLVQQHLQDTQPVEAYLLKPLSRMAKYRRCLEDLEKTAGDSDRMRASREELQSAVNLVRFHLRHGDDLLVFGQVRGYQGNIAEEGVLLRQADFVATDGWGNHKRRVFLFEDMIMFTKEVRSKKSETYYQYKSSFKVSDFGLKENILDSALKMELTFRKTKPITLVAENQEKKEEWVAELRNILLRQFERLKERMKEVQIGNDPLPAMSRPNYDQGTLTRKRSPSFMSGSSSQGQSSGASVNVVGGSRYSSGSSLSGSLAGRHLHSNIISGPMMSPSARSSVLTERASIISGAGSTTGSVTGSETYQTPVVPARPFVQAASTQPAGINTGAPATMPTSEPPTPTPMSVAAAHTHILAPSQTAGYTGEDAVVGTSSFLRPAQGGSSTEETPDKPAPTYDPATEQNVQRETSL